MNLKETVLKMLSGFLGLIGFVLILAVVVPLASYEAKARREYPELLSPIPEDGVLSSDILGVDTEDSAQVANSEKIDYTNAANWFVSSAGNDHFATSNNISFYTISIPKLGIRDAAVAIGGVDLSDNLVQYPGTALPGKRGNSVVFGHSLLPVFYNPENYLSIFSTIDTLEIGNKILVDYDGISYTYRVRDKYEVKPTDVYILDQNEDGAYLSLVTCSPPGDWRKPKRLVVRTELVSK